MHDGPSTAQENEGARRRNPRRLAGRLERLVLKELREILRDRRTIITLVVMPLLIYPLLALVFQRFLLTSLIVDTNVIYDVGVESDATSKLLLRQLAAGDRLLREKQESLKTREHPEESSAHKALDNGGAPGGVVAPSAESNQPQLRFSEISKEDAKRHVIDSSLHLAILGRRDASEDERHGLTAPMTWELVYRVGSPTSEAAMNFVESRLRAFSESQLDAQLRQLGVGAAMAAPTTRTAIDFSGAPAFSLAALIPLILVLMTVTGAVYPAIDLTAGERERGTLETLIAAPVPRLGLLLAKYVAVLTVALLTAVVNLIGMSITAQSTGLASMLFGEQGMTLGVVLKVLLLLGLFAAFFSAILLALTSYARSFKEAQAYIIPLMLLCLVPGIVCLVPGLEFTGWLAVTPLINIVLLARDTLEGDVQPILAVVSVVSTALYVMAAVALAARIFGTDAILYGSPATWSDLFRRSPDAESTGTVPAAMFTLAAMFPLYFVLASTLAHSAEMPLDKRMIVSALVTTVVFACVPLLVALFNGVRLASGFALRNPSILGVLAGVLLGVSLWPFAHEVFLANQWFGISALDEAKLPAVQHFLERMQQLPYVLVIISLAVVPGVCEELFFRGFLFTSLRSALAPWRAIAASALLFGVFHVVTGNVLMPERFLPSTFLGLVLGWVRWQTGSVWPCMLLHVAHNSLLLSVSYWRDALLARGIGVQQQEHLPTLWLVAATAGIVVAVAMLLSNSSRGRRSEVVCQAS